MQKFINLYQTQLSSNITAGAIEIPLYDIPTQPLSVGEFYVACLESVSSQAIEIVKITAINANSVTVVRGWENTTPLAFAQDDKFEIRLTAGTCADFYQHSEVANQTEAEAGLNEVNIMTPLGVKQALDFGLPIGSILAWNPGYYADAANGGFVLALGATNDAAGANAYLNPRGWYVCDGTELNLASSPIFNGAGRYLPKLTDDRFLMGSTQAGGNGGSNSLLDHTHTFSLSTSNPGNHTHSYSLYGMTGSSETYNLSGGSNYGGQTNTTSAAGAHTHTISGSIGSGNAAAATDNRPKYLSTFYILKAA